MRYLNDECQHRVFGVYEGLDAKISHYLTARTPPDLFNLVFSRLESDFETKNAGSSAPPLLLASFLLYGLSTEHSPPFLIAVTASLVKRRQVAAGPGRRRAVPDLGE